MNQQLIDQQYKIYLQKRAEKQAEEAEAKRLQEQHRQAVQAAIAKKYKVVTVRKARHCDHCDALIAKGEKATVYSGIGMVAWEQGEHGDVLGHYTEYSCQKCRPLKKEVAA